MGLHDKGPACWPVLTPPTQAVAMCACEVKVGHGPRHVVEGECVELERRELRQQLLGRGGHLRSKVVISVGTYVVTSK